jgi:hypothetical protein
MIAYKNRCCCLFSATAASMTSDTVRRESTFGVPLLGELFRLASGWPRLDFICIIVGCFSAGLLPPVAPKPMVEGRPEAVFPRSRFGMLAGENGAGCRF